MDRQATIEAIERIDRDHRTLSRLFDKLQDALVAGRDDGTIETARQAMLGHLDAHIAFEEELMAARDYPLTFTHKEQHQAFRDQVASILAGIETRTVSVNNVAKLLKKTHAFHTKYSDETLCLYMRDKYAFHAVADGLGI